MAKQTTPPRLTARKQSEGFSRLPVSEPSGVAYHPLRNSLFVVSDSGELFELDLDFNVVQRIMLRGDLEGVSVHPTQGTVYVASESAATVYEYDLQTHRTLRIFRIDFESHADFAGGAVRNKGIEGISIATVGPGEFRLLAVAEAEPARLITLSSDVSEQAVQAARRRNASDLLRNPTREWSAITASCDLGLQRLSDVTYCPSLHLAIVVSAGEKVVLACDLDGNVRGSVQIPGRKPEGLCILPGGEMLVAQDTGGVWRSDTLLSELMAK